MKKFVDSYCNYLKKKGIIVSDEQLEICAYGLELIVSAILNIVILVMCSFVLHEERYILFYFLEFIPLRLFAGGYHADNHLNCCIIFAGIYVVSVFLRCIAEPPLVLCFIVVETLLILLLSPVESVNKQITSKRRRISRNRSIWILLANVVVCIVFLWVQPNNSYIEYYLISGFLASSTMIAGKIKLHFASRKKEGASLWKNLSTGVLCMVVRLLLHWQLLQQPLLWALLVCLNRISRKFQNAFVSDNMWADVQILK